MMSSTRILFVHLFLIFSSALYAQEEPTEQEQWGELSGMLRFYYIFDASYISSGRTKDNNIDGSALGGHLHYTSPTLYNIGASAALYFAMDTGLNDFDDPDTIGAAGRFFTKDYSAKAILGELNLFYKDGKNKLVAGRQKIDSPLTDSIYTFMPNMFEALFYSNTSYSGNEFVFLHIDKMAYGTRAPVEYGLIGETTKTAGATQNAIDIRGEFLPIEQQILVDPEASTNGITGFAYINTSLPDTTFRLWDFYAYDIINMLYADATYKGKYEDLSYSVSAQYLNVHSTGKDLASEWLDADNASLFGAKISLSYQRVLTYLAYNHSGDAKLLNPWGADPAYTSSFFSRNAYRANVDAYKLGVTIAITKELKVLASHADYGRSTTEGRYAGGDEEESLPTADASESSLLFSYKPTSSITILSGAIYKESEYSYLGQQVRLLDLDLVMTYRF